MSKKPYTSLTFEKRQIIENMAKKEADAAADCRSDRGSCGDYLQGNETRSDKRRIQCNQSTM